VSSFRPKIRDRERERNIDLLNPKEKKKKKKKQRDREREIISLGEAPSVHFSLFPSPFSICK